MVAVVFPEIHAAVNMNFCVLVFLCDQLMAFEKYKKFKEDFKMCVSKIAVNRRVLIERALGSKVNKSQPLTVR